MTQNNEREAVNSIEFNDIALKQQSEAWQAVCCALDEVKPNWMSSNLPAMECAVNAIKELTQSPISQNEQQPKQIPDGWKLVPIEPSDEHLKSMAIRSDHGLGVDGYYDTKPIQFGASHAQIMESTIREMRQLYEEAIGEGFYKLPSPTNTEVGND